MPSKTIQSIAAAAICMLLLVAVHANEPTPVESNELHQLFKLSDTLYSGAQPEDEAAFAALRRMGVRTIVSVDGARTDVKLAEKYGMKYVHLPVGYEGITGERAIEIAKAAKLSQGPVYMHCHHGKHRGPAAAALAAVALEDWSNEKAVDWIRAAGTSPNYAGLYRCVANFKKPTDKQYDDAPTDFPSQVEPESFIAAMTDISITWDQIKELAANDYKPLAQNPDITATHEALQLNEHYRELMRTEEYKMLDDDLQAIMSRAEQNADQLHRTLKQLDQQPANTAELNKNLQQIFTLVGTDCKSCHSQFRDNRNIE